MTQRDFLTKWLIYGLALLPVWFLEVYVLSRVHLFGVSPTLLPLAAIRVAVLEGGAPGAGFGLAVGVICDAVYGTNGAMTLSLTLLGAAAGITAQYLVRQNLVGSIICSAAGLFIIELFRVGWRLLFQVADLTALLKVAVPEFLFSIVFTPLIYAIFHWVWSRTQFATLF